MSRLLFGNEIRNHTVEKWLIKMVLVAVPQPASSPQISLVGVCRAGAVYHDYRVDFPFLLGFMVYS
jgi:hypothetical protein